MSSCGSFSVVWWEYAPCCDFQAEIENKETCKMFGCFVIGSTGVAWFPTDLCLSVNPLVSSRGWTPSVERLVGSPRFTLLPVFIIPAGI